MTARNRLNTSCRVCKSTNLTELFSLGEQYVSDFPDDIDKVQSGPKCEIALQLCNNCTLIQQKWTAPQDFLYTRHYWYRSGVTQTMREALRDIVMSAVQRVHICSADTVLDIGANDGTLLSFYPEQVTRIACEPAKNMQEECKKHCSGLMPDFWSAEAYFNGNGRRECDKAKIITAIGMFYDLDDPNTFIADVAKVLHPEGIFVCQLMCAKQMLENMDVGNLSHEHLEFYTLQSLTYLMHTNGLEITEIEENMINGGSYRLYIRHKQKYVPTMMTPIMKRMNKLCKEEIDLGTYMLDTWREWYKKLKTYKSKLRAFIAGEVDDGKTVYVYGASTKGNVILQWLDVNNEDIPFAADKSEEKWGKYTVGNGIKIVSEDEMRKAKPDYLFVLPYSFVDEFQQREIELLKQGTRLIVPLPTPRVIGLSEEVVL